MWDLFDFNNDGKTSLFEKVVGLELLENSIHETKTATDVGEFSDVEIDEDNSDELDSDDYESYDDDEDFEDADADF